eukprot:jgi/Picsp_1/18/NSC_00018-R1_hypothetical protein CHLNCDRAFT_50408 [Chlorella variabilis]
MGGSHVVTHAYFVVDLSLLRGDQRKDNLEKLVCAVARAWLWMAQHEDWSFGFSLFDSDVGGYMLSYQLNMVAQGMGIPKHVAMTSASNLSGDDIVNFLTLVKLVTDKEVVAELKLRTSRNSRSSDIPAVELCKVLHAVIKSPYIQKLAPSESQTSGDVPSGLLVLFTPSMWSQEVPYAYVGAEAYESTGGCIQKALLYHIPATVWKSLASHRIRCCWVSAEGGKEGAVNPMLGAIEEEVGKVYDAFKMIALDDASIAPCSKEAFAHVAGLPMDQEASSKCTDLIGDIWAKTSPHNSIELLQTAVTDVKQLYAAPIQPLKPRKPRRIPKVTQQDGDTKQAMVGRGHRAMKHARVAGQRKTDSDTKNQNTTSTVNQTRQVNAAMKLDKDVLNEASPLDVEEACIVAKGKIASLEQDLCTRAKNMQGEMKIAVEALQSVHKIVAQAFHSVCLHQGKSNVDANALRRMFLDDIPISVKLLQKRHRSSTFESNFEVAWSATIQLLLRLCIGSYCITKDDERSEGLSPIEFEEIEFIMHLFAATMSPIPSQGQRLYLQVIRPNFCHSLSQDMKQLEKSMWDEDDIPVEDDGTLVEYRVAAVSLEASGETPDNISGDLEGKYKVDSKLEEQEKKLQKKGLRNLKETSYSNSCGPVGSADGSGIHGATSGATIGTIGVRNKIHQSSLMSRRFNNSKQFQMQVRVHSNKSRRNMDAKSIASSLAAKNKGKKSGREVTSPFLSSKRQHQVPDTPQTENQANAEHGMNSPNILAKQPACRTPEDKSQQKDVIPNTSPRNQGETMNARRRGSGPIRQPSFEMATKPGAIVQGEPEELGEHIPVNQTQNISWMKTAIVPRKKVVPQKPEEKIKSVQPLILGDIHEETKCLQASAKNARKSVIRYSIDDILESHDAVAVPEVEEKPDKPGVTTAIAEGKPAPANKRKRGRPKKAKRAKIIDISVGMASNGLYSGDEDFAIAISPEKEEESVEPPRQREILSPGREDADPNERNANNIGERNVATILFKDDSKSLRDDGDGVNQASVSCGSVQGDQEATSPNGKQAATCSDKENGKFDNNAARCEILPQPEVTYTEENQKNDITSPRKRKLPSVAKTANKRSKQGRLAGMLAGPTLHTTPLVPHDRRQTPNQSPSERIITIEDRGSPCKPSPQSENWNVSMPQADITTEDSTDNGDSCVGDTPDIVLAMKPLAQQNGNVDSDEEDAAILNAAANGCLSPIETTDVVKPVQTRTRTRKRSRLLRGTAGLADIKSRKVKKTAATPKTATKKNKAKKVQQLHLTEPPKKNQVKGVPEIKDELLCCVQFFGSHHQIHCEVVAVEEVQKLENAAWSCKLRVIPSNRTDGVESLIVHLESSGERPIGSPLNEPRTWARVVSSSPKAAAIKALTLPGITEAHNKAVKNVISISPEDSIQILSGIQGNLNSKSVPRRRLRPCHLAYEGNALRSAEKLQEGTPDAAIKARYRSQGLEGIELFPSDQAMHIVSPEATAAAGHMLGSLYRGGTPLVSTSVAKLCSPGVNWASPSQVTH